MPAFLTSRGGRAGSSSRATTRGLVHRLTAWKARSQQYLTPDAPRAMMPPAPLRSRRACSCVSGPHVDERVPIGARWFQLTVNRCRPSRSGARLAPEITARVAATRASRQRIALPPLPRTSRVSPAAATTPPAHFARQKYLGRPAPAPSASDSGRKRSIPTTRRTLAHSSAAWSRRYDFPNRSSTDGRCATSNPRLPGSTRPGNCACGRCRRRRHQERAQLAELHESAAPHACSQRAHGAGPDSRVAHLLQRILRGSRAGASC